MVAAGDVDAGRNLTAKDNITAGKDIKAAGDLYAKKLKIGGMELTSDSLKFNGVDIRRDADIPLYTLAHNSMYNNIGPAVNAHCYNKDRWRRLFLVKDQGYAQHLVMCLGHPNGRPSYWVVATGYWDEPQSLHSFKPK